MTRVFCIAEVEVIDPETFKSYGSRVADTVTLYGGRYTARGGNTLPLEGEPPKRFVIFEWESIEDAKRWDESPEYAEIIGVRHKACKSRVFLVEGPLFSAQINTSLRNVR